jgi:hypothetical protein
VEPFVVIAIIENKNSNEAPAGKMCQLVELFQSSVEYFFCFISVILVLEENTL